jgi:hypothetical protein
VRLGEDRNLPRTTPSADGCAAVRLGEDRDLAADGSRPGAELRPAVRLGEDRNIGRSLVDGAGLSRLRPAVSWARIERG